MEIIRNIFNSGTFESIRDLGRGKEFDKGSHRDVLLDFDSAKKHVKKVLIGGVKVAAGIGGFLAVSRLMAGQNSFPSALGLGAVAIGGSLLLTSRVSVILYDATKITAGLALFKIGFLDFCVFPAVASVKALSFSMPRSTDFLWTIGKGYGRLFVGALSFVGAAKLMDGRVKKSGKSDDETPLKTKTQKYLIDRKITGAVMQAVPIVTRMLGYPAPPSDTRNLKAANAEYFYGEIGSDGSSSE